MRWVIERGVAGVLTGQRPEHGVTVWRVYEVSRRGWTTVYASLVERKARDRAADLALVWQCKLDLGLATVRQGGAV
jgi:hypothetical protein